MTPALFLFELLKMGKLTSGPLALYHLPKYWSKKPVIKKYFRILKKKQKKKKKKKKTWISSDHP